ncbi:hypothetical protein Tco_0598999 [Tanacetum coccineum]
MSSNSDDIQESSSDILPPMLDRTDYESWSQRIRLYYRGKENELQILQSIDQEPFELGTTRNTLGTTLEGGVLLGPERPHTCEDLSDSKKKRYDADVRATNIVLQGLPKDIYKLINHNIEAKAIWDNVKMLLAGNGGAQNRAGNANTGQGKLDKMLLMQAQENGVVLDEDELLFLADCRILVWLRNHAIVEDRPVIRFIVLSMFSLLERLKADADKSETKHAEYDESNTYVLERFNTSAGNPVKKILLKLNLSDHRLCKMVVECQSVKVKEFQERCNIKAFQEWYEHVGPEVASPQGGKVTSWRRDYAWLMISRCSRSLCQIQVQGTSSIQEVNDHYNIFTRERQEYELKTKDKA